MSKYIIPTVQKNYHIVCSFIQATVTGLIISMLKMMCGFDEGMGLL